MTVTVIFLIWLGLAFGSFVSALTWRVHEQSKTKNNKRNLSIVTGRSQCTRCGKTLTPKDLIPVVSWLINRGKCRFCGKKVSWQYPATELGLMTVFVTSYLFWPGGLESAGDWLLFITWLLSSVGLTALLVYDARWMILPNRIIYPTALVATSGRLAYIIGFEENKIRAAVLLILSITVASGIFWLLFMVSNGRWIGFGDVRLGLITGAILASPSKSFLMILLASVLGTLFALPGLLTGAKTAASKLPYGPFLIVATFLVLLFGGPILDWYNNIFIP
ncbi:prepilin peptidase [Candidatus Saccharibacteria bacterium]|nr:prepilin peptidase [Candidatus Saccharibacteria bacterium]